MQPCALRIAALCTCAAASIAVASATKAASRSVAGTGYTGYGAVADGAGGQRYVRFPPYRTIEPLPSTLLAGTFFADDYGTEYALMLVQGSLQLASIDPVTATIRGIAEPTIQLGGRAAIAADPSTGTLYAVESDAACDQSILISLDRVSGVAAQLATLAPCSQSIAYDAFGTMYSIDRGSDTLQTFDGTTLSQLGALGIASNDTSTLATAPGSGLLLLFQFETDHTAVYAIDTDTGAASLIDAIEVDQPIAGIALATPSDDLFADGFDH